MKSRRLTEMDRLARRILRSRRQARTRREARDMAQVGLTGVGVNMELQTSDAFPRLQEKMVDEMVRTAFAEGAEGAAHVVAAEMRRLLKVHDSRRTGSRDLWSRRSRQRHGRYGHLVDSIVVSTIRDDKNDRVVVKVGPNSNNAYKGYWLEFGRTRFYWGRKGSDTQGEDDFKPQPFARPAQIATANRQEMIIRTRLRKFIDD